MLLRSPFSLCFRYSGTTRDTRSWKRRNNRLIFTLPWFNQELLHLMHVFPCLLSCLTAMGHQPVWNSSTFRIPLGFSTSWAGLMQTGKFSMKAGESVNWHRFLSTCVGSRLSQFSTTSYLSSLHDNLPCGLQSSTSHTKTRTLQRLFNQLPHVSKFSSLYGIMCWCVFIHFCPMWLFVRVRLFCPWDSRQEYWSGLPFPSPEGLPDPGIEPKYIMSPVLAGRSFTTRATWEALMNHNMFNWSLSDALVRCVS